MIKSLMAFLKSNKQTKYIIFMFVVYALALAWTTVQSYARLEYSRTGTPEQILIQPKAESK